MSSIDWNMYKVTILNATNRLMACQKPEVVLYQSQPWGVSSFVALTG